MSKASLIQTAFNAGELSPYIAGRPDVAKYAAGCETMEGFIPLVEGPAITRPGTPFVAEVKNSSQRTWLIRFEFSAADSYMLEFGNLYVRFYFNRAQVVTAPSTPYEISSPYTAADLTDSGGALALRFVQTGDVIYIVHPDHPPYKLSRFAATNWTLATVNFNPPPFKVENITATTIYASAATGVVTLEASADTFSAANLGQYIFLREKNVRDVLKWEAGASISSGAARRYNGKNYGALNSATTGGSPPIHDSGAEYDGNSGVQWEFTDPGYGWAKITSVTDATTATATVISRLPVGSVGSGNATTRWSFQAWNETDGYPTCVTFFRERLVFARNESLWFSVVGDFENFATEVDGVISDDAGFDRTLASDRANTIRWLSPGDVLLVGTIGDEWAVTESTTTDPFGPNNVKTKRQSTYGSNTVAPQRVGGETIFVQKAGAKVRAMPFAFDESGVVSPNLGAFARTITRGGVVDIAYQQEPWSILWMARADGLLVGLTLDREQDVVAWHRHPFDGGAVECVECIPSPDGGIDDLWLIVRYIVNGQTKRYIAHMSEADAEGKDQADWQYSDMALTYTGAPATIISGLDHLEGKTVWVLVDGARHPDRTVSSGQITLQIAGEKVFVGLPSPATLVPMSMDGGNPSGTSQGKTKRANLMTLRLYRSLGGTAGPTDGNLEEIRYRLPSVPMGSAPPPFTGDVDVEWGADYDKAMRVVVRKDRPMPITLVAIMPQVSVESGR